jgi:hypothetical protein
LLPSTTERDGDLMVVRIRKKPPFTAEDAPIWFEDIRPNPHPEKGWEDLIKTSKEIDPNRGLWPGIMIWACLLTIVGVCLTIGFKAAM